MASLLLAAGAHHIITMGPHAAQTQAFRIPWVTSMQKAAILQWVRENIPARGTVMDRQTKHGVCLASPREKENHGVGRMILVDDVEHPVAVLMDDMSDAVAENAVLHTAVLCQSH